MDYFQDNSQKNINNALAVVKLASLFFCAFELFNMVITDVTSMDNVKEEYYCMTMLLILTVGIGIIYWLWTFFTVGIFKLKNVKAAQICEFLIYILIYSVLMFSTNGYKSNLKFLFLCIIITTTIQLGKSYGLTVAIISTTIVLAADWVYGPKGINLNFQNDLTLVGIFILIAWTLGHYVEIERDIIASKNRQLETMDMEIKEHNKQREYMEELLLKDDGCYNLLIENSNDAIFVHRKGKIIFGNESASKLVEVQNADMLINTSFLGFMPEKDRKYINNNLQHIYNKSIEILTFEHELENSNGDIIVVRNTSTFFMYEGKPTILSILHNITSEKQVEKLERDMKISINLLNETRELNKIITEFFSNISHELKTPLNVIFSAIQLLNVYKADSLENYENKQEKYLKIMKQNCYRLMRLINNILDMTKLDSGFLKLNLGNYNIVSIVEDIVLSVASYAESKGISITFDTDVEEKIMAFDPDKVERIILNLLSNAVKFTGYGGEIFVDIEDKDDKLFISVRDTGVGIPEEKLQIIFERFIQVDKTLRRDHEGSGIGLSLVKSFVEMHQGKISINSKLGYGSEFIIELPVKVLEEDILKESYTFEDNIERINIEFSDIYSECAAEKVK